MHENASTKVAVTSSVTPVHGRPEFSKHRNSNHQRNLSLDFRYDVNNLIMFGFLLSFYLSNSGVLHHLISPITYYFL